jgi:tetratricopeptide (TPR) repeat protein
MGDLEEAKPSFEECLKICEELGMMPGVARALRYLGLWARGKRDYQKALALYQKSLAIMRESGDLDSITYSLMGMALTRGKQGDLVKAIQLFGASNKIIPTISNDLLSPDRNEYDQIIASARSMLGEDVFTTAWNDGFAMNLSQAIELAMMVDVST